MIAIVCLDLANGMLFNKRRQSRDRVVIEDILSFVAGRTLWMNNYSRPLFADKTNNITADEAFLNKASPGDFCFIENLPVKNIAANIEKFIVYRWDKKYPQSMALDVSLQSDEWEKQSELEMVGFSHEKITKEIYTRKN